MNDASQSKISSSDFRGSDTKTGFSLSSRTKIWLLVLCLTLMIGASIFAMHQPLNADPFDATFSTRFWYPHETNPYAHLQAVHCANLYACRFNSVAVNGSGNLPEVWAVGNVGLVLHRAAGQTKWEQLSITATELGSSTPSPKPTPVPRSSPIATPVRKPVLPSQESSGVTPRENSIANSNAASNAAAPAHTPAATQTPSAGGTSSITVPRLLGMGIDEAQKMAIKSGLRLDVQYESGSAPNPTAQQGPPTALRIVKQSPEQGTVVPANSVITVMLGRAPSKARLLIDQLVPTVYASTPEQKSAQQQQTRTGSQDNTERPGSSGTVAGNPNLPPSRLSPLDDDLIFVDCIAGEICHVFGRSGRIYLINSEKEWSFTQALLLGSGSLTPIDSPAILYANDWYKGSSASILAKSNGTILLCLDRLFFRFQCSKDVPGGKTTSDGLFLNNLDQIAGGPAIFGNHAINHTAEHLLVGDSGFIARVLSDRDIDGIPISEIPSGAIKRIPSSTIAALSSFAFTSTRGFIVGDAGIILGSTDTGNTWRHETQGPEGAAANHRLPAIWYWVFALCMLVFCSVVVAAPIPPPTTEFSVADWAVSDAPLKPGDFDSLGFTPMALGLSRFIRNPKTQPPVTIAIEGEWGEGKSSVMSLLRGDLEKSRFRPVWFNAWHQSEDQLLAALLEHIKSQAIPPWWHIDNWIFRVRLVDIRLRRKWPLLILLALALCSSVAFEISRHGLIAFAHLPVDIIPFKDYIPGLKDWLPQSSDSKTPPDFGHFTLVVSMLAVLGTIFQKAKAFGINPAKLTDNLRAAATIKDIKPDPGIRRQFAREFGDLCSAWCWGGRRVIIFIDDLDRCRPESVVTVLESINFLTTAGDCMMVLGIAQKQVTHCVGLSFKDIAQAEEAYKGGGNTEQEKAEARFNYGALYIRKLVNIIAPLPRTTEEQRRQILNARAVTASRQDEQQRISRAGWRTELWQSLAQTGQLALKVAPLFGLLLAVILSVVIGYQQGVPEKTAPIVTLEPAQATPTPTSSSPKSGAAKTKIIEAKPLIYDRPTTQQAILVDSNNTAGETWLSYGIDAVFFFIFFGMLAYQLTARTNQDAQNSPDFENSLKLWGPYIVGVCDTPREIKRALNDLRYQAMTRRTNGPSITRGERMIRTVRQFVTGRSEESPDAKRVDEAALPAWKAGVLANLTDEEWKYFLNPTSIAEFPNISENLKLLLRLKSIHMKQFEKRWIPEARLENNGARAAGKGE